jgi:hypothetical protein
MTSVDFAQSKSTGYGKMCNVDLGLLVVTDQESGNRPQPLANIRRMRRPLVRSRNPQAIQTEQLDVGFYSPEARISINSCVFSVFRVLMCDLRVLGLRFHPIEQLNH